jgi:hypothetical protein
MKFDIHITRHTVGEESVYKFRCPLCEDGGMAEISDYDAAFVQARVISHLNMDHYFRMVDLKIPVVDAPTCSNEIPLSRDLNLRCTLEEHERHIKHENVYRVGAMTGQRVIVQWQVI